MFVYASPLIGGWLADKWLGHRLAITFGAIFFAAGYFLLYVPSVSALYLALTLVVIGNGFFKPNVSAMVGDLYPEGSKLKDSAYNIFYMGINIGAFLAPVVAEFMRQRFGFRVAFTVAGFGMVICMATFWSFRKYHSGHHKGGTSSVQNRLHLFGDRFSFRCETDHGAACNLYDRDRVLDGLPSKPTYTHLFRQRQHRLVGVGQRIRGDFERNQPVLDHYAHATLTVFNAGKKGLSHPLRKDRHRYVSHRDFLLSHGDCRLGGRQYWKGFALVAH
jgi:hypothetical protein